MVGGGGWGGGK